MGSEDEDLTLKLADDLLLHILSFLPTKDALRTSVLSTRWRYLWSSFSNIDLDDSIPFFYKRPYNYPHCRTFFLKFVDRLLLGHDGSDITRFKVSCDVNVDVVRVHSWISDVIKHNVEEIDLQFPVIERCILPSLLFTSRSLTTLSINLDGLLEFPSSLSAGGCPCLKSLNLSRVEFLNDNSTKKLFSELSSIFPMLQQLSLLCCEWKNIINLIIRSSTLESITMHVTDYYKKLRKCEVVVIAPKLVSFYCETEGSIGIHLGYPASFVDASLDFTYPEDDKPRVAYERLVILLGEMRNTKRLTVTTWTISASRVLFESLPVLDNLPSLHIIGFITQMTIVEILEFMQKTPNLEYLSLTLDVDYDVMDDWWSADPVTVCQMNKLKKLTISGLDAVKPQLHLIRFFLENSCNLETIEVHGCDRSAENLETLRNELVALPRSSEKCVFVFELLPSCIQQLAFSMLANCHIS